MRSNPTAAFDKSSQAQFHVNAAQAVKRLAMIALRHTSKRQAKQDKQSLHKARAWHCSLPHINTILRATKQSRITWI
jgi:hypothetical protein